jgi:hypothetical protein
VKGNPLVYEGLYIMTQANRKINPYSLRKTSEKHINVLKRDKNRRESWPGEVEGIYLEEEL